MQGRILTGRYGSRVLADPEKYLVVRTSVGTPRWPMPNPIGAELMDAAPLAPWLHLPRGAYEIQYLRRVSSLRTSEWERLLTGLVERAGRRQVVLCCYEDLRKPDQWCHRRLFADYIAQAMGLDIPELQEAAPVHAPPSPASPQGSLF